MNFKIHLSELLFLSFVLLLAGCIGEAPRDNPLDPLSTMYSGNIALKGRVLLANQTAGVSGANVSSLEDGVGVLTDSSGYFSFLRLSLGAQTIVCAKNSCVADTQRIVLRADEPQQLSFALNGLPGIPFTRILTRKIDQYFPSPQYFVDIAATVTDPNGVSDLDTSVWFSVDTLLYPMTYSITTKNFEVTLYKYDFPTNTIDWLVGKSLKIIATDIHGASGLSAPFAVTRIIENEAIPTYPSSLNNDTTRADSLVFRWNPPDVTFNYSYSIVLSRVDAGTRTVVWTLTGLSSFFQEVSYPTSAPALLSGNYVWTIAVVDDFGNYARSKESSFVIK